MCQNVKKSLENITEHLTIYLNFLLEVVYVYICISKVVLCVYIYIYINKYTHSLATLLGTPC